MSRNKYPEETIAKILDTSLRLFLEKGYEKTTIQDIVNNLEGLTKGAIYHHFKSKEEILDAALDRADAAAFRAYKEIRDDQNMSIIREGMEDGTIRTEQPREMAEVLVLLANLWVAPIFSDISADQLAARMKFYMKMLKEMGADLSEEKVVGRVEQFRALRAEATKINSSD